VADGAYARKVFVQGVGGLGYHVLARLRSDTVFYELPPVRRRQAHGQYKKGHPRKSGKKRQAKTWRKRPKAGER
jgi:hypothetical protein